MTLHTATPLAFPFRVMERVGEGAMGVVYRAMDLELGRQVALKTPRAAMLESASITLRQTLLQRFEQEARAAAALSHPNITVIYRVGVEQGVPYMAMEWLDGTTLEDVLAQSGPMPFQRAVHVAREVLAGLGAAHAAGIIHRDIKPGNIMLLRDGRVKVTDFGVARVIGGGMAHTLPGTVVGTPWYAAPEQLTGQGVDGRSDLYAVGVVLHEMLTGRPPHDDAEDLHALLARVYARAVSPPSTVPGVPPALDSVVLRALEADPAARPSDAASFSASLAAAAQSPVAAHTTDSPSKPTPRPVPAATLATAPITRVDAAPEPRSMVLAYLRRQGGMSLEPMTNAELLRRVTERPLHAAAFAGAVNVGDTVLLVAQGVLHSAWSVDRDTAGDDALDALPPVSSGELYPVQPGASPRLIPLLASLLAPPREVLKGLHAGFTDLGALMARLAAERFDGAVRLRAPGALAFIVFDHGTRVLELFSSGWPDERHSTRWESWVAASGAVASVEAFQFQILGHSLRQQLQDVQLSISRPALETSATRVDTAAAAQATSLVLPNGEAARVRRGSSTAGALVAAAPVVSSARWVVSRMPAMFDHHGRTARWKALVQAASRAQWVRLYPQLAGTHPFDVAAGVDTTAPGLVVRRVGQASASTVTGFVAQLVAFKRTSAGRLLDGGILIAPAFSDVTLAAYQAALQHDTSGGLVAVVDGWLHREGWLRISATAGLHVLLVEENGETRRPLMPA